MKTVPSTNLCPATRGKHVVLVGCGNIGSFLLLLLARMVEIAKLTLVDFDHYTAQNNASQQITPTAFGKPKARVLARMARQINPGLVVVPLVARVESVPVGKLRGDVMLACVDSKGARLHANEIAWHLGMPLLDAGIEASGLLARVNSYQPAPDQPCLECAWDLQDYDSLPVLHPCSANIEATPSTGAPACLGALAASLQAIECQKILCGDLSGAGKQILIQAKTHMHFITSFRRNANCRFDHQTWSLSGLKSVPPEVTLSDAIKLTGSGQARLAFPGMQLVRQLACPGCGLARRVMRLDLRLQQREKMCPRCGQELLAAGFHSLSSLSASELDRVAGARSLGKLGLREGDIIRISSERKETYFELGGAGAATDIARRPIKRRFS